MFIDSGEDSDPGNLAVAVEDRFLGWIGSDGLVLTDWNESGGWVVVTTAAAAVVGLCDWGIFLVALIGLESSGAQSEPIEHISHNVSSDLNVNLEFSIALSCSSKDGGVDQSTQHTRRYPLED